MKIVEITDNYILFDNGNKITYDHDPECCEENYADFKQLDDVSRNTEFDPELKFEIVPDSGFRFGNKNKMFFVPCYSDQNGYYTCNIQIYYNNIPQISFNAELRDWF